MKISPRIRILSSAALATFFSALACGPATEPAGEDEQGSGGSSPSGSGGGDVGSGGANGSGGIGSGGSSTGGAGPGTGGVDGTGAGGLGTGGGDIGTGGGDVGTGGGDVGSGGGGTLPPEAIIFQEDFEAAAEDTVPANWHSFVGYVVDMNNMKPDPFALADSTKAHGGTKSLHVNASSQPAMLTRALPQGTNKIYVRAYVWLTNKLGQNPGHNHETLLGVRGTPGGANDEVRFGEIKGVIGTNEVPSDDISPTMDQWGMGPLIAAGEWNCIEVAFLGEAEPHEVRAWNNGTEVHAVNSADQWQNGVLGTDFLTGKFNEFIIGWHSFSSYANEIWFDDIIVATQPIGCD